MELLMVILAGSSSAFWTFMAIACVGFIFLLASLTFGELFGHADLDHSVDVHGELHGGVSFFSSRVLSVFVTAFGGFGAVGVHLGYGIGLSSVFGLVGGAIFGGLVYLFAWFLYSQQASSEIRESDLVGKTAQVSVGIPKGGLGQVRCTVGPTVIEKLARSKDSKEIPQNMLVTIDEIVGETCIVSVAK